METPDFGATIRVPSPGQKVFQRYTLKKILGRGGMGIVWLAHDDKLDREVALKFLPEVVVHDPKAIDELKREARRNPTSRTRTSCGSTISSTTHRARPSRWNTSRATRC
jgi:serine/threonine protein kinase